MKISNRQKGQTLIETAFILLILLFIVFAITEFARSWFTKNSLKNAARQGARVAVVTPIASLPATIACNSSTVCPNSNVITNATCCQPGVPRKENKYNTQVNMFCGTNGTKNCTTEVIPNDPIKVRMQSTFFFVVGGPPLPWPKTMNFTEEATMRYE